MGRNLIKLTSFAKEKIIFGALCSLLCFMGMILLIEYRFFKLETARMIALKEDYRNHLVAVNKVLQDYNKAKERIEELESGAQKKKTFRRG